jgi:hypothetical protein
MPQSSRSSPSYSDVSSSTSSEVSFTPVNTIPYRTGPSRPRQQTTFVFIDALSDLPEKQAQKQAYLLKKYHRNKKQVAIDRLRSSKESNSVVHHATCSAAPRKVSHLGCTDLLCSCSQGPSQNIAVRSKRWPARDLLGQSYIDPFNVTGVQMSDSMNLYFHHCKRIYISLCLGTNRHS